MERLEYTIKTPIFEGPLDLLLDLVTKRKLFINDISLAAVTDDFLKYIEDSESEQVPYGSKNLGGMAEFLVIASTLMLIKSRSLLPMIELSEDEEEDIHDLEERLKVYAQFQELSQTIKDIFGKKIIFEKTPSSRRQVFFSPDSKTNTGDILLSIKSVMDSLPAKEPIAKATVRKVASLEETIEKLSSRIQTASRLGFKEFYSSSLGASGEMTKEKKVSIIVGFLAMLELVRRGAIQVTQELGGEIEMAIGAESE